MKTFYFMIFSLALFSTTAAMAQGGSGDMFSQWGFGINRPAVPSDAQRGEDLFPSVPLYFNRNADMLRRKPIPNYFGREDMLVPRNLPVPHEGLFRDEPVVIRHCLYCGE